MARYRLAQHSRSSRVNVDVFVDDPATAKRWLAVTPDTYRVRLTLPTGQVPDDVVLIGDESNELASRARSILADPEIGAAVVGEVASPRLKNRRRAEPEVGSRLMATTTSVLDEVGGVPAGDHPLPGLLARVRDAGYRIGLIPISPEGAAVVRTDPIEADAIVILAAVPMHDIGGGARSTQLALEFLKQGFHVTLVSLYGAQESVDLGLRFIHPNLEQYQVEGFNVALLQQRTLRPGLALVEAPAGPLVEKALALKEAGWKLVYDVIDDWSDPALGGEWFRPRLETNLIEDSDAVIASAPDLVRKVEQLGGSAHLVPNAVNADVFGVDLPPRPVDLPEAKTIIGYHGSLYGDWFDWEALARIAEAYPEAAVVLIGDDKTRHPEMPKNVHFLGLKAQTDLPAYLQRFDVGIIPFKVNDTTHAVSPLKVYEYLASGVPIAAPPLRALETMEGVHFGSNLVESVLSALAADKPDRERALATHSWRSRVLKIRQNRKNSVVIGDCGSTLLAKRLAIHWSQKSRLVVGTPRVDDIRNRSPHEPA